MAKYLTINQYKLCSDYPITSDITDIILARTIQRAEAHIDAYQAFDLRLGGFEPHTAWVEIPYDFVNRKTRIPNYPVPIRRAIRYRIQISNNTNDGSAYVATINNNDVAYNVFGHYIEIVPMQSITVGLAPALIAFGLNPTITQLDYEVGYYFGVTGETLIDSGDHTTYYAMRGFWATTYTQALSIQPNTLPVTTPNVYANGGSALSSSLYTYNATEGTVKFNSARSSSDIITLDYTYTIPDEVWTATVAQTSWILAQRALTQQGLLGIDTMKMGDQMISRKGRGVPDMTDSYLCEEAHLALSNYMEIAVA